MAVVAGDVDFSYRVDVARGVTLAEPIPALKGITLSIPRGGRCAVLGANGAGKSTLLRLLAGRHTPDNGVASILDEPCRSPKLNGRVAYVPAARSGVRICAVACAMAWRWTRRQSCDEGGRIDGVPTRRGRIERETRSRVKGKVKHRRAGAAASPR